MSILAWATGSCPGPTEQYPYGTCCYKWVGGVWLKQSDNSTNGGVCDTPTIQGQFQNRYVLVECHAPG